MLRFWSKVQKTEGCWLWLATKDSGGYGRFWITHNKSVQAHTMAYKLTYGDIPEGRVICHKCDNPTCVRPDHLFEGTRSDNMIDALRKGRHPALKYPLPLIEEAKRLYKEGGRTQREIAKIVGIDHRYLNQILRDKKRHFG